MSLFQLGEFTLHSGQKSNFKVECDSLTNVDWGTIAQIISDKFNFDKVVGVGRGGQKLAKALEPYAFHSVRFPLLIVDDVLTTGASMEEERAKWPGYACIGAVVFARGKCPNWVWAWWNIGE